MANEFSYIQLASVALGGILTFAATAGVEWLRSIKKGKNIQCALIAEIEAMLHINSLRLYKEGFISSIDYLKTHPIEIKHTQVKAPIHYSRIYQQNASDIGLIDKDLAVKIVKFHQFIDSVIQDVTERGVLYKGGRLGDYEQTFLIYNEAIYLGEEILRDSVK